MKRNILVLPLLFSLVLSASAQFNTNSKLAGASSSLDFGLFSEKDDVILTYLHGVNGLWLSLTFWLWFGEYIAKLLYFVLPRHEKYLLDMKSKTFHVEVNRFLYTFHVKRRKKSISEQTIAI